MANGDPTSFAPLPPIPGAPAEPPPLVHYPSKKKANGAAAPAAAPAPTPDAPLPERVKSGLKGDVATATGAAAKYTPPSLMDQYHNIQQTVGVPA